jgi:hypothetical protein
MRSIDWFEIGALITGQAFADGPKGQALADQSNGPNQYSHPTLPEEGIESLLWQQSQEQL